MKTFHYREGHEWGKTLTVGELRVVLNEHPDDMPVLAAWEGIHTCFGPCEVEDLKYFHADDPKQALVFDVDQR